MIKRKRRARIFGLTKNIFPSLSISSRAIIKVIVLYCRVRTYMRRPKFHSDWMGMWFQWTRIKADREDNLLSTIFFLPPFEKMFAVVSLSSDEFLNDSEVNV